MSTRSSSAAWIVILTSASLALGAETPDQQREMLAKLEAYATKAQQQWSVPGLAIAIVKGDEVIYAKGFGVKRVGGIEPVGPDTVFQIGSMSKAFTAALVATQVDDEKLAWSDRVIDHLPSFEMYDPWVTREFQVVDLMAQHSGMPAYASDGMPVLGYSADDIVAKLKLIEPVTSFRTEFAYVNNLFLVAADLARATSGKTWAQGIEERLLRPLEMKSSSTGQAALEAASSKSFAHKLVDGKVTAFAADAPELAWAYTLGPAGGINSTARDMAQWLRMLVAQGKFSGKQIVGAENLRTVMTPHTVIHFPRTGPLASTPLGRYQSFYCNGWISTAASPHALVWHNGDTGFMHAAIGVLAEDQAGIVVLTNLGGSSLAEALVWRFFDLVNGNPESDWSATFYEAWSEQQKAAQAKISEAVASMSPAQPPARYAGTFSNPVYGDVRVDAVGKELHLVAGPAQLEMKLVHRTHDTFVVSQPHVDSFFGEGGFATFAFGNDGNVASVTLSGFADVDGGRFVVRPPS